MAQPALTPEHRHLLAPYHHICQQQSKGIRTKIVSAFNDWIQLTSESEKKVNSIVGMLHNASLLVDDIEDGATLRRGQPVAHEVFGTALTLNCANHMYFTALADVMRLVEVGVQDDANSTTTNTTDGTCGDLQTMRMRIPSPEVKATAQAQLVKAYTDELQQLHIGQGLDIFWRDTFTCPKLNEYEEMVAQKTGGLFRLSLKLMLILRRFELAVLSPSPEEKKEEDGCCASLKLSSTLDHENRVSKAEKSSGGRSVDTLAPTLDEKLVKLVNSFSVFFQILDDWNNLKNDQYHKNKSFCEDLTEGKFSYLITHSVIEASKSHDTRLYHALRQRPVTEEMKKFCLDLMEETGTFAACTSRLKELKKDILEQVSDLGGNPKIEKCLADLEALGGLV